MYIYTSKHVLDKLKRYNKTRGELLQLFEEMTEESKKRDGFVRRYPVPANKYGGQMFKMVHRNGNTIVYAKQIGEIILVTFYVKNWGIMINGKNFNTDN